MITKEILEEMLVTSGNCTELAKQYNVSKYYVWDLAKKYNIDISRKQKLVGKKFSRLLVIREYTENTDKRYRKWLCQCDCGKNKVLNTGELVTGNTVSCGCYIEELLWKGHEEISGTYWNNIKVNAKNYGGCELKIEEIWDLFLQQERKCALSGMELEFAKRYKVPYMNKQTASLDRIDSSKGYTLDNVQWLHKSINLLKNNYSQKEIIEISNLVYHKHILNDPIHLDFIDKINILQNPIYEIEHKKPTNDLTGIKFGNLTVLLRVKSPKGHSHWLCECVCGNKRIILSTSLTRGKTKSCRSGQCAYRWDGFNDITGMYWNRLLFGAKKRNLEVGIDKEDAWELYLVQDKRCALTNMCLDNKNWSLDRIDSSQGYISGNVQWIYKEIQFMKRILSQEQFIDYCTKITLYQQEITK